MSWQPNRYPITTTNENALARLYHFFFLPFSSRCRKRICGGRTPILFLIFFFTTVPSYIYLQHWRKKKKLNKPPTTMIEFSSSLIKLLLMTMLLHSIQVVVERHMKRRIEDRRLGKKKERIENKTCLLVAKSVWKANEEREE